MNDDIRRTAPDLTGCFGVLTLELNLGAPEDAIPPAPLSREAADKVAGSIAADLARIIPGLEQVGLVIPAALYDQTELLRPGFPLLSALEDLFKGTLRQAAFQPQIMALGTDSGSFPMAAIDPARAPGSGPLLLLPFTLIGERERISQLSGLLENTLLQGGEVSPATRRILEQAFGIRTLNLSYATLGDLCALLKVQLDEAGFPGLWELLMHGLFRRPGPRQTILAGGQRFLVERERAWTNFQTFDDWARFGAGQEIEATRLGEAYGEWTRIHRQYVMALEAYGLPVSLVMGTPSLDEADPMLALEAFRVAVALDGDYLVETVQRVEQETSESRLSITNQFSEEVATLAYTVESLDRQGRLLALEHHYPLRPRGLEAIIEGLRRRSDDFGVERQVLHPWRVVYSLEERCLMPAENGTGIHHGKPH
ncbi:MAG: hypothetical protein R3310_09475 [Candidatus Competibacteraceae bacterium]|nr:hypothetical protein [Candidatus Competibacteraceae bacterium]